MEQVLVVILFQYQPRIYSDNGKLFLPVAICFQKSFSHSSLAMINNFVVQSFTRIAENYSPLKTITTKQSVDQSSLFAICQETFYDNY